MNTQEDRAKTAVRLMADEAERRGEDCEDTGGNVRAIVEAHGLGFNAWFCVCCEIANRASRRRGFTSSADEACSTPAFKQRVVEYAEKNRWRS